MCYIWIVQMYQNDNWLKITNLCRKISAYFFDIKIKILYTLHERHL